MLPTLSKQRSFSFEQVRITSEFQCGNLSNAVQRDSLSYDLWIDSDPLTTFRTWFYFSVEGIAANATVTFSLVNMSNQLKLFKEGHVPVFRSEMQEWSRIRIPIQTNTIVKGEEGFLVAFRHLFTNSTRHYFAFTYPWSNGDNDRLIRDLISQERLFTDYRQLCLSTRGRPVNILTVTQIGAEDKVVHMGLPENATYSPYLFEGKRGIFVSARVHPGETAASHMLNGFLKALFSTSREVQAMLSKFVFYIIPIINPDGVAEGNFRTDSLGRNLNRFYTSPTLQEQPEIFHIKHFLLRMISAKKVQFCLDLHSHVNKQGVFVYGNSAANLNDQVAICLFPKILEFNSDYFDYDSCNFSERNMASKDKIDEMSKEGAARVAIFKETGLPNCWTFECNYNSTKVTNKLPQPASQECHKSVSNGILNDRVTPDKLEQLVFFNVKEFQEIGRSILSSMMDYYGVRDESPIFNCRLKNMQNIRLNIAINVLRMIPFHFDNQCRKLLNHLNSGNNMPQIINQINAHIGNPVEKKAQSVKRPDKESVVKIAFLPSKKTISNKVIHIGSNINKAKLSLGKGFGGKEILGRGLGEKGVIDYSAEIQQSLQHVSKIVV